jgi:hypothetical protein
MQQQLNRCREILLQRLLWWRAPAKINALESAVTAINRQIAGLR